MFICQRSCWGSVWDPVSATHVLRIKERSPTGTPQILRSPAVLLLTPNPEGPTLALGSVLNTARHTILVSLKQLAGMDGELLFTVRDNSHYLAVLQTLVDSGPSQDEVVYEVGGFGYSRVSRPGHDTVFRDIPHFSHSCVEQR